MTMTINDKACYLIYVFNNLLIVHDLYIIKELGHLKEKRRQKRKKGGKRWSEHENEGYEEKKNAKN